jgi:trimeric autotransporter adhesin
MTFLIYKDQTGGEPLFTETQRVVSDSTGHYMAHLGASMGSGIPLDLFSSGEARWLEVQIAGEKPQSRILLVSVPYALKAADAAILGGLPASALPSPAALPASRMQSQR